MWDTPSFKKKTKKKRYRFFYILHIIKLSHTKRTTNAKQNCCFSHWTDEILIFCMLTMFVIIEPPLLSAYLIEWKETSYCYNNVPVYIERESLHFHNFWPFHYVVYFYFTARLIPEPFSWSLQQLSQSGFEWVPLHQDDPRDCTLQFHPPHSNDKQKVKGNVNNTSLKTTIIFPNQ